MIKHPVYKTDGSLSFEADIDCSEDTALSWKLRLSVLFAIKHKIDLSGSNLSGSDLSWSDLSGSNLSEAKNAELPIAQTIILPEGDLIVWKKCKDDVIVKLRVPSSAKRSSAAGRKCRAEYVEVLEIIGAELAYSTSNAKENLVYKVGETVRCVEPFCEDRWQECASGIHFYITRIEAENH